MLFPQEFAAFYDVDLQKEPFMLRIIQEASAAPLPAGWVEIEKDGAWLLYSHEGCTLTRRALLSSPLY